MSERLMRLLLREVAEIEAVSKGGDDGGETGLAGGKAAKERIETIGHLTRTLEKLFDLQRQERGAGGADETDGPEVERLRDELLRRLKVLDRMRRDDEAAMRVSQAPTVAASSPTPFSMTGNE